MSGIAALPMYDFPEIRPHTNNFWHQVRDELKALGQKPPENLSQPSDLVSFWQDPELIFAQTCGLPFVNHLTQDVQILGTPDYGLSPKPGRYHSVFIVRKNDAGKQLSQMRGSRFCYNDIGSQSGLFAPMFFLHSKFGGVDFFAKLKKSGGHLKSVEMVASGQADIAAIDAVSWRYIKQFYDCAQDIYVLEKTDDTPGLPFICANSQNVDAIKTAVEQAINRLPDKDRMVLGIQGFWRSTPRDYDILAARASQILTSLKKLGLGE